MAQIEWQQSFSVGNEIIDREHMQLIEEINQLYTQLDEPVDALGIEILLGEIQVDISAHFAFEELLMREACYAEYEDHKQDHENLLDEINDMIFSFTDDPASGCEMLMNRLSDWFGYHFASFDKRLHNQLG